MSLVLAIEPDSSQADILRQLLRDRLAAKVEMVDSKDAALAALNRQVPDLILVSALLSPRDEEEIVAHLRSLGDAAHLQTLTIPQLRRADVPVRKTSLFDKFQKKSHKPAASGCDPAVFAEEVSSYLARGRDVRRQRRMAPPRVPLAAAPVVAPVETPPAASFEPAIEPSAMNAWSIVNPPRSEETVVTSASPIDDTPDTSLTFDMRPVEAAQRHVVDKPVMTDETASGVTEPSFTEVLSEIEQAAQQQEADGPSVPLDRGEEQVSGNEAEGYETAEKAADLTEDLSLAMWEGCATTANVEKAPLPAEEDDSIDEIDRLIRSLGVDPKSIQTVEVDGSAEADSPAIIEISPDGDSPKQHGLRRRKLLEVEPVQIEPVLEVVTLEAEVARVRAEAEQTFAAELNRVRSDAEALRSAAQESFAAAETAAARALEEEVARVRAEAEARLRIELDRLRKEAEDARTAEQSEAKARAEEIRQATAREAREIAETAASRTLEAEIARVRADAEARLAADLVKVKAEAEQRRQAELEEIRRQVAEMREAAAEQARSAAEVLRSALASKQTVAVTPKPFSIVRVRSGAVPLRSVSPIGGCAPATTPAVDSPSRSVGFGVAASDSPFQESKMPQRAPEDHSEIRSRAGIVATADTSPTSDTTSGPSDYYSLWRAQTATPTEAGPSKQSALRGDRFRRARWALPVAASLLLAVGDAVSIDVTSWFDFSREAAAEKATAELEPAAPAQPLRTVGKLQVESTPSGARIRLDGHMLGESPLTLPEIPAGRHALVIESSAGTVTRTITVRQGETTSVVEAIFPGWITVFSRIPLELYANRRHLGSSDDGQIMIEQGRHEIELVNQQFNFRKTDTFEIVPGKVTSYNVTLPTGVVHVNAALGGEVWIEGELAGYSPIRDLLVPIGTREILVRHPEFGERREFVDVRAGQATEVTLNVTR